MKEEREYESGNWQGDLRGSAAGGKRLNPENGLTGASAEMQRVADEAIEENLMSVVTCILENVKKNHLPSLKLLFEVAMRVRAGDDIQAEEYQSLAEYLTKAREELMTVEGK